MHRTVKSLAAAVLLALATGSAVAAPAVVVTIKPVHALVAAVMAGTGAEPKLLVSGRASEHDFALKPSDARAIAKADVVFRVSDQLEGFMRRPLAAAPRVLDVELIDTPGLVQLAPREGGVWEAHVHGDHDGHDDEGHDHEGDDHEGDDHEGGVEPHIWLDPRNARTMTARIAEVLISRDGANAATYRANAAKLDAGLAALDAGLAQQLAPLAGKPFIVFHDAYQYFEHRYGLTAVGSITVSPERKPSAQRIQAVRDRIRETGARCVFAEPQFDSALVATLTEGTGARAGSLDPTGADGVPAGPDAYAQVLRRLAENLGACLGG